MSAATRVKRFVSSYTGRMLVGMLSIHTVLVPLVFMGVLTFLEKDYQSQFINNARSQSALLASLISENPNPDRINSLISDQLLSGQVALAEFKRIDAPVSKDFGEDFFSVRATTRFITSSFRYLMLTIIR